MNRKWIVPVIVAGLAGALAFGVTRHAACRGTGASLDCLQDVSALARSLGLSDAQVREIQALHASLGTRLNDCCARHCAARARLGQALTADTNGTAQAEAIVKEMCRAYEESELATLNHIRAVRATLNEEQRRRFDALISECRCERCGAHGDNGTAEGLEGKVGI